MTQKTLFDVVPSLSAEVDHLIRHYKDCEKRGWSFATVTELSGRFIASVTRLIMNADVALACADAGVPLAVVGADHQDCIEKHTVLAAFERFYDTVIAPIDIPFIPDWIESTYVDTNVRNLLRDQAGALFDLMAVVLRRYVPIAGQPQAVTAGPATAFSPF